MYNYFVYGSLLNKESASHVLKQDADDIVYRSATLEGWELAFDVGEDVIVNHETLTVAFLNIKKNRHSQLAGKLIALSEHQIEAVKKREKNYNVIELEVFDHELKKNIPVLTVCGETRSQHLPILQGYIEKVKKGAVEHEAAFIEGYLKMLGNSLKHRELIQGEYQFSSLEQNKLTGLNK